MTQAQLPEELTLKRLRDLPEGMCCFVDPDAMFAGESGSLWLLADAAYTDCSFYNRLFIAKHNGEYFVDATRCTYKWARTSCTTYNAIPVSDFYYIATDG